MTKEQFKKLCKTAWSKPHNFVVIDLTSPKNCGNADWGLTTLILLQPLRWCCVDCVIHHKRDVREEQHHTYMWREQAIIE